MGGAGAGDLIFYSLCGKKKALDVGGPSSIDCKYFWGSNKKQRSCDGRGARSTLFGVAMNPKRRVRAAHGRARAAKIHIIFLIPVLPELVECNFELENMRTVLSLGRRSYQIVPRRLFVTALQ